MSQRINNKILTLTSFIIVLLSLEVNGFVKPVIDKFVKCFDTLEKRRQIIKKAFLNFLDEAFFSSSTSSTKISALRKKSSDLVEKLTPSTPQYHFLKGTLDLRANTYKQEFILLHGYKVETHSVVTIDGYKLSVNRVQRPLQEYTTSKIDNNIVLLHHGLLGSSIDWLFLGPNKSLPYLLSEEGYDVWLTNARGNKYSRNHVKIGPNTSQFWDFSVHEIGYLDLSTVIDYIRERTQKNSLIHFIGHSMGATALLVLLSTIPHYNFFLNSVILLAPLSFMYKVKGPLLYITEAKNVTFLGDREFVRKFPDDIIEKYCEDGELCLNSWLLMANGGNHTHIEKVKAQIREHTPGGGSTKTILHYAQLIRSDKFQMFDYGPERNMQLYGSPLPREYPLDKISSPVVLFSSKDDWLATTEAVAKLAERLSGVIAHHVVLRPGFSHIDFLWAHDAPLLVYRNVLSAIKQIKKNSKLLMRN